MNGKISLNALFTVLAVLVVVVGAGVMAWFPSAGRLVTLGKDLAFPPKLLDAHLTTIERQGEIIKFISDGTLGRVLEADGKYWHSTFSVATTEEFYSLPGLSTATRFRLERILADGVDISYETRQRPRSANEKESVVDRGVLHLAWRQNQSRFNLPPRAPEKH
ncbi:MAG: hypothetical protein OEW08_01115 [Gammaproteobacteria bacterium]|nr:hypothetical protein [Gammaproteobacteria bacterium]